MTKIVVTGAGSAQSNGVINCLLQDPSDHIEIIGLGSDQYDLFLSPAQKKYLVPHSTNPLYKEILLKVLNQEKPDMIHFQHDKELYIANSFRKDIEKLGVKLFIPDTETIDTCVHKYKSWQKFQKAGIQVPKNLIINNPEELKKAFSELGKASGKIWLRSTLIGGGGKGALPTNNFDEAVEWINAANGWGNFVAAELLTDESVTWLSIWHQGELVVAQGRKRLGWAHSALSPSGVTGITKVGKTYSDDLVDEIAQRACYAVSNVPHGIYGVDLTYDFQGIPNPTEINIGRFFTTVEFFAQAGLNMPVILKDLCLYNKKPDLIKRMNPLPDDLIWIRGMDCRPVLATPDQLNNELIRI